MVKRGYQRLPIINGKNQWVGQGMRIRAQWISGVLLLTALGLGAALWSKLLSPSASETEQIRQHYLLGIDTLSIAVDQLSHSLETRQSETAIKKAFYRSRLAYKRIEGLTELYTPETAKTINGPALPEIEEGDPLQREILPEGFQVIEEMLFPAYDTSRRTTVLAQVALLRSNIRRLGKMAQTNQLTDSHIFDAMRLEVFRIISLGVTGFDSPIARHSLPEAASALDGLRQQVGFYQIGLIRQNPVLAQRIDQLFSGAIDLLQRNSGFDSFDRLRFISQYGNALSGALLDVQKTLAIPVFEESRLLSPGARSLSDSGVFNPNYFVNSGQERATVERIALGKQLFSDPVLSGDGKRTCATCHQPGKAFTSGEAKDMALGFGDRRITRNTPTLIHAAFQAAQFHDSRVVYLEDQAGDVIQNKAEMHGSLARAVGQINQQPSYRRLITQAYPHSSSGLTELQLKNALASYVRSLTGLHSRFDRYMRGQPVRLTNEEKLGFNLFMGKARCATCHFYPLFNGTVPPAYGKTESEVLGVPATALARTLDPDLGKYNTTRINLHRNAFKTPTVRNSAQTAPYMHNGVYKTLAEVVDFYDKGGGKGLGLSLENQTLPGDKLNLTAGEKRALTAFMKALSDAP
ncbi:MAG TPA: cytochrome c peroxidase [Spirosoma sp.]|nr:cytochrome c peroxidase [Spirosoma sp.]